MDVTFIGLVCFIKSAPGQYRAAMPDGTNGDHPCNQFGNGKTDPHAPLICAAGLRGSPTWKPVLAMGQFGLFPVPDGPVTIGNIAQGPGVNDTGFKGLRGLKADWDSEFAIDLPVGNTQPGCKAWVDIRDGSMRANTSGVADTTTLALPGTGNITVSSSAGSFDVDLTSGSLVFVNASWDAAHRGVSHFYLYYRLDKKPHCRTAPVPLMTSATGLGATGSMRAPMVDGRGNFYMFTLMADCSNTTYP